MADSGPSRRRGWILRVRVITRNGLDSFGDLLGTDFRPCLGAGRGLVECGSRSCRLWGGARAARLGERSRPRRAGAAGRLERAAGGLELPR